MESHYLIDLTNTPGILANSDLAPQPDEQVALDRLVSIYERDSADDDVEVMEPDIIHEEEDEINLEPVKTSTKLLSSRRSQKRQLFVRARYPRHLHQTKFVNNTELLKKKRFDLPPSLKPISRYNGQAVIQSCKSECDQTLAHPPRHVNHGRKLPSFPVRRNRTVGVQCQSLRAPDTSVAVQCHPDQSDFSHDFNPDVRSRGTMKTTTVKMRSTQVPAKTMCDTGNNATVTTRPFGVQATPTTSGGVIYPTISMSQVSVQTIDVKDEGQVKSTADGHRIIDYENIPFLKGDLHVKSSDNIIEMDTNRSKTSLPVINASISPRITQNGHRYNSEQQHLRKVPDDIVSKCAEMQIQDNYASDFESSDDDVEKLIPYGLQASCEI